MQSDYYRVYVYQVIMPFSFYSEDKQTDNRQTLLNALPYAGGYTAGVVNK